MSSQELDILRTGRKLSIRALAALLPGRSDSSIKGKRSVMGVPRQADTGAGPPWGRENCRCCEDIRGLMHVSCCRYCRVVRTAASARGCDTCGKELVESVDVARMHGMFSCVGAHRSSVCVPISELIPSSAMVLMTSSSAS